SCAVSCPDAITASETRAQRKPDDNGLLFHAVWQPADRSGHAGRIYGPADLGNGADHAGFVVYSCVTTDFENLRLRHGANRHRDTDQLYRPSLGGTVRTCHLGNRSAKLALPGRQHRHRREPDYRLARTI